MAYLAIIGSHKVNGVAELHSGLVKEMMHDFVGQSLSESPRDCPS